MKVTQSEAQLLQSLWRRKQAFLKELVEDYELIEENPDRRPKPNTIATYLKRMADKKLVAFRQVGNARQYYPLISKRKYFSDHFDELRQTFFENSASQLASFFTETNQLSKDELQSLRDLLDQQLKDQDS
ncbi:MAG: BlaI/MecI/CopY family transcriptional regulator [Bacteroidota bacterium]